MASDCMLKRILKVLAFVSRHLSNAPTCSILRYQVLSSLRASLLGGPHSGSSSHCCPSIKQMNLTFLLCTQMILFLLHHLACLGSTLMAIIRELGGWNLAREARDAANTLQSTWNYLAPNHLIFQLINLQ